MAATRERLEADVKRLESERLRRNPRKPEATPEELIRQIIHVLACALGVGRTP